MTEEEIQSALSGHRARNDDLRRVLIDKGVSLTEERPVDLHFWSRDHSGAAILARELYRRGYLITVLARSVANDNEDHWNVEAGVRIAPQKVLGDQFSEDLTRLAAMHNSFYGGWGTSVG